MTLGGIEAGGTKFVCVITDDGGAVIAESRFATRDPGTTLANAIGFFQAHVDAGGRLDAIGIAAFGPLELRPDHPAFGCIVSTPKAGWSQVDLLGPIRSAFGVPVRLDTDVNGAALAEGRWGAAQGLENFVYITVGTGIGGGLVIAGRPAHGLVHPEMGHLAIPRDPADAFAGSCPFHGDCFEGLASGTAVAARWGVPAHEMDGPMRERAVALEAGYLAAGIRNIVYATAPERVIVGGGISELPGLFPQIRHRLAAQLAAYPNLAEHSDGFVVPPALGHRAGPLGAIALASLAVAGTAGRA